MALKYFLDTHIAKATAEQLRTNGVDVVRCEEVGLGEADDTDLLRYATDTERVLVSQDADVTRLHAQWQAEKRAHSGIMKVSGRYQGEAQVSYIVRQLLF